MFLECPVAWRANELPLVLELVLDDVDADKAKDEALDGMFICIVPGLRSPTIPIPIELIVRALGANPLIPMCPAGGVGVEPRAIDSAE